MRDKNLAAAIKKIISIPEFIEHAEKLHQLEKNFSHRDFDASTRYCVEVMKQAGFSDVERLEMVCDGQTCTLDNVMPEAWDRIGRCYLEIVNPELNEAEKLLADTDKNPISAAIWSGPTPDAGVTGAVIDYADCDPANPEVKGKFVLYDGNLDGEMYYICARAGALGLIGASVSQASYYPDDILWINGVGRIGWYHTRKDRKIPVFSITPRQAIKLRERMKQAPVTLHGVMRTQISDGKIYTVTARIPGEETAEMALFAHIYEPFLNDDASGFALAVALGEVIKKLSDSGVIRLRKSLRLVISMENYGFSCFMADPRYAQNIFAAQNLDGCVGYPMYGAPQKLRMSALCNPFFGDLELERLIGKVVPDMTYVRECGSLSDDTFGSDPQLDIPTLWIFNCPDRFHHCTCPAFNDIDPDMVGKVLILLGTYLAGIVGDDRKRIAQKAVSMALKEYAKDIDDIKFEIKANTLTAMQVDFRCRVAEMMVRGRVKSLDRLEKDLYDAKRVDEAIAKIAATAPTIGQYDLSPQRCRAANMVATRLTRGIPFSLGRIPYDELPTRKDFPIRSEPQFYALFDGQRSVWECAELLTSFYRSKPWKDANIAKLIKYLEYLAEYGYFKIEHPLHTTQAMLKSALKKLGVKRGMRLEVHSAMASLGDFEGGPEALCRLLTEAVGNNGTIMMPSFNFYNLSATNGVFDWAHTPSLAGAVSECFRNFRGVIRSLDPSHPVAVWGADQIRYVAHHHQCPTMGQNSPLGLLELDGGYALMISCFDAVSFMHIVETSNHVPCLGSRNEIYDAILPDGTRAKLRGWGWRDGGCRALRDQDRLSWLRRHGKVQEMMLGVSHLVLFKLSDYRAAQEHCMKQPGRGCRNCPTRPRQVVQNVPTDWDEKHEQLKSAGDVFVGDVDFAQYVNQ